MRKTYPVIGAVPGARHGEQWRAIATGEYRPPTEGEWYISGAIPEAYQAPNDLTQKHRIARLERGRMVTVWEPEK